jgi:hypothetical protein
MIGISLTASGVVAASQAKQSNEIRCVKPDLETVEKSETKKFGLWTKCSNANSVRIKNLQLEIVNTKSRRDALTATKAGVVYLPTEGIFDLWCRGTGEISRPHRIRCATAKVAARVSATPRRLRRAPSPLKQMIWAAPSWSPGGARLNSRGISPPA